MTHSSCNARAHTSTALHAGPGAQGERGGQGPVVRNGATFSEHRSFHLQPATWAISVKTTSALACVDEPEAEEKAEGEARERKGTAVKAAKGLAPQTFTNLRNATWDRPLIGMCTLIPASNKWKLFPYFNWAFFFNPNQTKLLKFVLETWIKYFLWWIKVILMFLIGCCLVRIIRDPNPIKY